MNKQAITVKRDGQADARRFSIKCLCCKTRFTEEHAIAGLSNGMPVAINHSCEPFVAFTTKHLALGASTARIMDCAFRAELVRWGTRADGSTTKCNAKCQAATGPDCDCSCKAKNHGGA